MLFENKIVVLSGTFPIWPGKESQIAGTPRPPVRYYTGLMMKDSIVQVLMEERYEAVNTRAINKCRKHFMVMTHVEG